MSLSYAEIGATRDDELPDGYGRLSYRTRLGDGERTWVVAAEALMSWRMHETAGVRVTASAPRAAPGVTVVCRVGFGPLGGAGGRGPELRFTAPCAVVWTVADERAVGFAYGTLVGHPECGEEAFLVAREADGSVWFTVRAFSRPAAWYTRLAGPAVPLLQRAYAWRCGAALRTLCAAATW